MIKTISYENLRGKTDSHELGERTFLTGPNGSGKSTIVNAAYFALTGKLPGYKVSQMFENSSSDIMSATVVIGEHTIKRTLTQGKTLSETVKIGAEEMSGKAASPAIRMILGGKNPLIDMKSFYACSPSDQRRMILGMVMSKEDQNKLMEKEAERKKRKNELAQERQAATKAMNAIVGDIADMDRPVGTLKSIQEEEGKINSALDDLSKKIAEGEANENMRQKLSEENGKLEEYRKGLKDSEDKLKKRELKLKKLEDNPNKIPEPELVFDLPVPVIGGMKKVIEKLHSTRRDALSGSSTNLISQEPNIDDAQLERELMAAILEQFLPSEERQAKRKEYDEIIQIRKKERDKLSDMIIDCKLNRGKYQQAIESAEKSEKALTQLGPGPDQADYAMKAGMENRRIELRESLRALNKIESLEKSVEKWKIREQKLVEEENKAKEELKKITEEQSEVVMVAASLLVERSKSILPDGCLIIDDDGKSVDIAWNRDDKRIVSRTTLSGGEQCIFDAALGHSLAPEACVILEGGEIDRNNMRKLFHTLEQSKFQVIVASWFNMSDPIVGWNKIKLD